jgi:hypothetical protein
MYVRFLVGADNQCFRWLTGVITMARLLRDEGKLKSYEIEWLEQLFDWYNVHLHDVPVRVVRSKNPGRIVYEDEYLVVAESLWRKSKK